VLDSRNLFKVLRSDWNLIIKHGTQPSAPPYDNHFTIRRCRRKLNPSLTIKLGGFGLVAPCIAELFQEKCDTIRIALTTNASVPIDLGRPGVVATFIADNDPIQFG
jgi:hypothetical protein